MNNKENWVYGGCNGKRARKHKVKGNVQFVLWEKGEQGHTKDFWHNFDCTWWGEFITNDEIRDIEQVVNNQLKNIKWE